MWRSNPATAGSRFVWTLVLVSLHANWQYAQRSFILCMFKTKMQSHNDLDIHVWHPLHSHLRPANRLKRPFLKNPKLAITCYLSSLWVFIFLAGFDWWNTQCMHTKSWNTHSACAQRVETLASGDLLLPPSQRLTAQHTLFQMQHHLSTSEVHILTDMFSCFL